MNFYSINISETYILNSTKAFRFDELLRTIMPILSKNKGSLLDTIKELNENGFVTGNVMSKSIEGQPLKLDRTVAYKSIRYMFQQKMLLFMDGMYELMYNFEKKFLSITTNTTDYRIFFRLSDVNKISKLITPVRDYMSGLCEYDNSPKAIKNGSSKAEQLAASIKIKHINKKPNPTKPAEIIMSESVVCDTKKEILTKTSTIVDSDLEKLQATLDKAVKEKTELDPEQVKDQSKAEE